MNLICDIYRSDTKSGLYLYLQQDKTLEDIPEELLKLIGKNTLVMEVDLNKRDKLALVDIQVVKQNIETQGYHIQFPQDLVKNVINYT